MSHSTTRVSIKLDSDEDEESSTGGHNQDRPLNNWMSNKS